MPVGADGAPVVDGRTDSVELKLTRSYSLPRLLGAVFHRPFLVRVFMKVL